MITMRPIINSLVGLPIAFSPCVAKTAPKYTAKTATIVCKADLQADTFQKTAKVACEVAGEVAKLPNVHIKGLMTIAPIVEKAEENRQFFKQLKKLSVDIAAENIRGFLTGMPQNVVNM